MKSMNKISKSDISKSDINKLGIRWILLSQAAWSYNKMMAPGYFAATYPVLKKIYKDDEEGLKKSVETSINFYNSNPHISNAIVGMTIGMEESKKMEVLPSVDGLKTGLMGLFSGVGDTVVGVIIPTIFGAIAAYMAINGSPIGAYIWIVVNCLIIMFRIKLTHIGYSVGEKIISTYSDKLTAFTESAMILGLVVVGGLIPTIITANLNDKITIGKVPINLQDMANQLLPALVPVLLVVLGYKMLGYKRMTSTKLIIILIILSMILSITKILI